MGWKMLFGVLMADKEFQKSRPIEKRPHGPHVVHQNAIRKSKILRVSLFARLSPLNRC